MTKPSSAFPPNQRIEEENPNQIENFDKLRVKFRKLKHDDLKSVKNLHKYWFPIEYNNSFYDSLL